ncbi:MAG: GNAT family N-acetyltransferase [Papillibacter sp.]|jgi:RimJ/RimL family protein N-acetyltransferase|nr:GNAT family N-acetyltransferase [Papillibacter sp.]
MNKLLQTDRLYITEFTETMAHSVHINSLDEANRRFLPDEVFKTEAGALEAIKFLISCYGSAQGPFVYPVLLKDGTHIGHVEAVPVEKGYELGYHIAAAFTGKGYAAEAVTAFVPYIMDKLKIDRINGICHYDNLASRRVLEKCGFKLIFDGMGLYQGRERHICRYEISQN